MRSPLIIDNHEPSIRSSVTGFDLNGNESCPLCFVAAFMRVNNHIFCLFIHLCALETADVASLAWKNRQTAPRLTQLGDAASHSTPRPAAAKTNQHHRYEVLNNKWRCHRACPSSRKHRRRSLLSSSPRPIRLGSRWARLDRRRYGDDTVAQFSAPLFQSLIFLVLRAAALSSSFLFHRIRQLGPKLAASDNDGERVHKECALVVVICPMSRMTECWHGARMLAVRSSSSTIQGLEPIAVVKKRGKSQTGAHPRPTEGGIRAMGEREKNHK